jgi:hypothetical protein
MKTRLIIVAAIVLIWIFLAVSISLIWPRQGADEIAAATRTPMPTFTATATPTDTSTPSPTPTPTHTPTSTPTFTNTPPATDTPVPTDTPTSTATPPPTDTPTAAPTSPPQPTSPPPKPPTPKPTSTPALPFAGTVVGNWPNCGTKGVWGFVKTANGSPYPGVRVGVWSDAWAGRVSGPSEADGKYTVLLNDVPAGAFKVAVVNADTCGTYAGFLTADRCDHLSKPIEVTLNEIYECENEGTVQWSQVDYTGQ